MDDLKRACGGLAQLIVEGKNSQAQGVDVEPLDNQSQMRYLHYCAAQPKNRMYAAKSRDIVLTGEIRRVFVG